MRTCAVTDAHQQREPGAAAGGRGLVDEILEGFADGDEGLILLQVPVVPLPFSLPLVPDTHTHTVGENER